LKRLNDCVLVLREDPGKSVCSLNRVGNPGRDVVGIHVFWKSLCGRYDVRAHAELTCSLDRNRGVIARYHLDANALGVCHSDCRFGIIAWRVKPWPDAQHPPGAPALFRLCDT